MGDWVVASTILHGRGGGSGVAVEQRYVFVDRLRGARVVEGWEFKTISRALAFLGEGVSPRRASAG